jgi:hypothetical protein
MTQRFESSIVKIQADGDRVLSSYLEEGETLVPSSFAPKPATVRLSLSVIQGVFMRDLTLYFTVPSDNVPDVLKKYVGVEFTNTGSTTMHWGTTEVTSESKLGYATEFENQGQMVHLFGLASADLTGELAVPDSAYDFFPEQSGLSAEFTLDGTKIKLASDPDTVYTKRDLVTYEEIGYGNPRYADDGSVTTFYADLSSVYSDLKNQEGSFTQAVFTINGTQYTIGDLGVFIDDNSPDYTLRVPLTTVIEATSADLAVLTVKRREAPSTGWRFAPAVENN